MTDFLQFIPLTQETIDSVRARIDNDANAGVDPSSSDFVDITEGGFFWDITEAAALEIHRLWDMASTEVPAVAFPAFAWGEFLDEHGETVGLGRKEAAKAGGVVRFSGVDTTLVATGTEAGVAPTGDSEDAVTYLTTQDGTISGGYVDIPVTAVDAGSQGNALANTATLLISPNSGVTSITNPAAITGGTDVEVDEDYRERILLELSQPQGAGTIADYIRWALAYPGIGSATVNPIWNGAGTVQVVVTDAARNPVSPAVKHAFQDYLDPPQFLQATSNAETVTTSSSTIEVPSTTGFAATGTFILSDVIINQKDTVTYTGKTSGTFTGCTIASGSHTYSAGARVAQGFGRGSGQAPIGATVTVDTVTAVTVAVTAAVTFVSGYSLDGDGGTIACRADITTEIKNYIDMLDPGEDVIKNHVISRFFRVRGVDDVTVSAPASNTAIASLEVAQTGTVTLT